VVTEAFFERPHALRRRHPALYEEVARFYRQDPATFVDDEG
jgi:Mlc titration factor MtfA (ptsG expression regulator)